MSAVTVSEGGGYVGPSSPTFQRRRLGRRLKEMREAAGLKLEEAAPRLDKNLSSLSRVETGHIRADVHLVRSMMDLYDIRDDELIDLARDAARKGWWRQYGLSDMGYVDIETEAYRVLEFTVLNIPGLLQTQEYKHAALLSTYRHRTEEQLRNELEVLRIRQQRLADAGNPLELAVILDEAALHRGIGGADIMRAQLLWLVESCAHPRVTLQVLPFGAGMHDAMNGAFAVLEFPEAEDPDVVYIAHVTGSVQVEKDVEVRKAKLVHDQLRSRALPPEASAELIGRLAEQLYPSP